MHQPPSSLAVVPLAGKRGGGWVVAGALALGLTLPAQARAAGDEAPADPPIVRDQALVGTRIVRDQAPQDETGAPVVVGDLDATFSAEARPDQNVVAVAPRAYLGIRPRPEVELHVTFGAVSIFRDGPQGRQQQARPGNLGFGASGVLDRREGNWRYAKVGFSFVLPTAFTTTPEEQEAYDYALAGRIGWDPWTWTPKTFGVVVPAELRAQVSRRWVIGGDGGLAVLLPSANRTDGLAIAAQVAGEARFVTRWMGLGVRMAASWNGRHPDDRTQAGVSPFVDASLCRRSAGRRVQGERARTSEACPVYALARLNMNLDGPYGFTGADALGVWGVQLGLGWSVY